VIGIVIALREELTEFLSNNEFISHKHNQGNRTVFTSKMLPEVIVIESGMGKENAVSATNTLIECYKPNVLISAGFSGSVKKNVQTGTSFICNKLWGIPGSPAFWTTNIAENTVIMNEHSILSLNTYLNEAGAPVRIGSCMTVDGFIYNDNLKTWVGENFPVDVIDMESYWVSQEAIKHNIEHIVVRVVLDPMEQKLPPFIVEAASNKKSRNILNGLKHVATNPGDIKKILQIFLQVRKARKILTFTIGILSTSEDYLFSLSSGRHK